MAEQTTLKNLKEPFGTLWINTDARGNQVVSGQIGGKEVYGYINEVTIKKGKRTGQKTKNIKIYEKTVNLKNPVV